MARTDASRFTAAALLSLVLFTGLFLLGGRAIPRSHAGGGAPNPDRVEHFALNQLAFEPSPAGGFLAHGKAYAIAMRGTSWTVALRNRSDARLRATLVGSRTSDGRGGDRLPGTVNYMVGPRSHWRTGVPTYGQVLYRDVYANTDVVYHGKRGSLEYDFRLRPGADPGQIRMRFSGARSLRVAGNGDLIATLPGGDVRQHKPVAYQDIAGTRQRVPARFVLKGDRVRFVVGDYDRARTLVIDPSLAFADYIGGTSADAVQKVQLDSAGNIYLAGNSTSASIPGFTVSRSKSALSDAFVMKLSPSGVRQWIAYLGGSADDVANDLALDGSGRPYITGWTDSTNFPSGNPYVRNAGGLKDAYVARFSVDGGLQYATQFVGPDTADYGLGIAVEGTGAAYIAVTSVFGDNSTQGYVTRYDTSGDGVWTQGNYNNTGIDTMNGVGVRPGCQTDCDVFSTGRSTCAAGNCDANAINTSVTFKYSTNGSNPPAFQWAHFYTTTFVPSDPQHPEPPGGETPNALAVDSHGNPAIVGTKSVTGPTHNYGFVARFDGSNGNVDPVYITWQTGVLNGDSNEWDIAFDGQDNMILAGNTTSSNDDTQDAIMTFQGSNDGQVVKYFPDGYPGAIGDGRAIVWNTYLGGTGHDYVYGVAADANGNVFAVGETGSGNFLSNPLSQPKSTANDGFLVKIRTNSTTISEGPSDTVTTKDVTFKYSSSETGGTFQCRLAGVGSPMPDFGACGALSQDFKGLADGSYTFEIKAFDSGHTTNGDVTSRAFAVDTALHARFTMAPNPVLAGRSVSFDGSSSNDAGHKVTKFEWDLDGNGSFETNTAGTATVAQAYPSAGTFNVGLRVTDSEGRTSTGTQALQVNTSTGPGTQFGVTINNGAQYTNDADVVVTSIFPSFTTSLLFSNDGGFGNAQTFPAKKDTKWRLDSSGPERLPKTIYVRFLAGSVSSVSYQDDIILDETAPKLMAATVTAPAAASGSTATTSRLRKFTIKTKASDRTSGVGKLQATANKKRPGRALRYKRKLVVKAAKRPKWVRVRDRAGNWSKWKRARAR